MGHLDAKVGLAVGAAPGCGEPIVEPALPIVDPHHHLWFRPAAVIQALEQDRGLMTRALMPAFRRHARYLLDEFLSDVRSGHNIRATSTP
jgi:hypothetical protein